MSIDRRMLEKLLQLTSTLRTSTSRADGKRRTANGYRLPATGKKLTVGLRLTAPGWRLTANKSKKTRLKISSTWKPKESLAKNNHAWIELSLAAAVAQARSDSLLLSCHHNTFDAKITTTAAYYSTVGVLWLLKCNLQDRKIVDGLKAIKALQQSTSESVKAG